MNLLSIKNLFNKFWNKTQTQNDNQNDKQNDIFPFEFSYNGAIYKKNSEMPSIFTSPIYFTETSMSSGLPELIMKSKDFNIALQTAHYGAFGRDFQEIDIPILDSLIKK